MTLVRRKPTKTAIRHVADLVRTAFSERGAGVSELFYRYDEDAEPGERHVYDLGAVFATAAGVSEFDIIVSVNGVSIDEVGPDELSDFDTCTIDEFFVDVVPSLPDLRPTSLTLDLLALYRRHGAVALDPRIDANLLHTDEDVMRACAMLDVEAVAPAFAQALWSMRQGAICNPN